MPSAEREFSPEERRALLGVARASIENGLRQRGPLEVDLLDYPESLQAVRASFVTLHVEGSLRGCIGTLEPEHPLVRDVAVRAHGAAFHDPRFSPLAVADLVGLAIHLSVLSPFERLEVRSREELVAALHPKRHGLFLRLGTQQATFLPTVWDALPDPAAFVEQLERKGSFPADAWTRGVECHRYTTEDWGDPL